MLEPVTAKYGGVASGLARVCAFAPFTSTSTIPLFTPPCTTRT